MASNSNIKKGALLAMVGLLGTVSAAEIRNLQSAYSDPFCHEFNSDGSSCKTCSYRYYKNSSNKCTQVNDLCKTWSNVNGKCLSCYPGYVTSNGSCVVAQNGGSEQPPVGSGDIDENCQCFNDDRECNECFEGYELIEGVCEQIDVGQPVDLCEQYQYVDTKGKWFHKWSKGCKKVCVDCIDGYYLDGNGECHELPQNCEQADIDGNCIECDQDFEQVDGQCEPQVGEPVDTCAQYGYTGRNGKVYSKWFKGCEKVCKSCIDGYYLNKWNNCEQLPEGCAEADYKGHCTECEQGFDLQDHECVEVSVGQGVARTSEFCVTRDSVGTCTSCAFRTILHDGDCYKVSDQCNTWDEVNGDCKTCYGGYKLVDGACVTA